MFEELEKYLDETNPKKIKKDWEKSKKYDKVGPTVDELLLSLRKKVFIPEERIVDFLNLLDNGDDPCEIEFTMFYKEPEESEDVEKGYIITLPDSLNKEWFLESVFEIENTKQL
jgi:hypothetical protein